MQRGTTRWGLNNLAQDLADAETLGVHKTSGFFVDGRQVTERLPLFDRSEPRRPFVRHQDFSGGDGERVCE